MSGKQNTILLLSFEMPPYIIGGIGSVAFETVKEFKKNGYEVIVIAPKDKREFPLDVQYYSIPIKNNVIKFLIMLLKTFSVAFKRKIIFIYSLTGTYAGLVALITGKLFRIKYFVVAHGVEFIRFNKNRLFKTIIQKVYNLSSKVFSVSNFTKNNLIDFGVAKDKIYVCYNGVNIDNYYTLSKDETDKFKEAHGIDKDKFILFTISRLDLRKGHIKTLQALKQIFSEKNELKNKIMYLIGGTGPQYDIIKSFIADNNLQENVQLLGFVEDSKVNYYYNICDLFIHPNVYLKQEGNVEGFGLVFLEAAAAGKTSIGGIEGGSSEAIDNGRTGFTVNGESISEIQEKILELFYNRDKLNQMAEGAHYKAVNEFNWNRIVSGILNEINLSITGKS